MATIKKLQTIFSQKGMSTEERHEVIYNFTGGRTESSRGLSVQELEDLCNALQGIKKSKSKLISECLKILEAEGIHRPNEPVCEEINGRFLPNQWYHLNKWMLTHSVYKKPLAFHTIEQLEVLRRQLYKLAENNKKSAKKVTTKAWWREGVKNKSLN